MRNSTEKGVRIVLATIGIGMSVISCQSERIGSNAGGLDEPDIHTPQNDYLSYERVAAELLRCGISLDHYFSSGRFDFERSSDVITEVVDLSIIDGYPAGERTNLFWYDRRAGHDHVVNISQPVHLRNIVDEKSVCPLVSKGIMHLVAADFVEQEFDRIYREYYNIQEYGFEQVLFPDGVWEEDMEAIQAINSFIDYEALGFLSQAERQMIEIEVSQPMGLSRAAVREAQELIDLGRIPGGDILSWFEGQDFWEYVPEALPLPAD